MDIPRLLFDVPPPVSQTFQDFLISFFDFLPKLVAALVVFFIGLYIASLARRAIHRWLELKTVEPRPIDLLAKIGYWTVVLFTTATALQMVGFNLTAFLAGLGIAGFTIGFALQDVSKNFIAGLLLLIQQPFNLGDVIEVTGFTGRVITIDLRTTEIRTLDGRIVLIPNGDVMVNPITNFSRAKDRRVDLNARIGAGSDLEAVRQAALQAAAEVSGWRTEPAPEITLQNLGGSTLDLTVSYWIDTAKTNPGQAKDAGLAALIKAFDKAGIVISDPAQTVYLRQ